MLNLRVMLFFPVGNHWICPTMNCILAFSARVFYRESQHVDPALKSKKTDLCADFLLILYGIELLLYWHCSHSMRSTVYVMVWCSSVCLSICLFHSPAAAACGGFAAVGPVGRRYRSIAARPAPQQHVATEWRAAENAGSATSLLT